MSKTKSRLVSIALCASILLSLVLVGTAFLNLQAVHAEPHFLDVAVSPVSVKLMPFQTQVFTASSGGREPVTYLWYAKATENTLVKIDNNTVTLASEPSQVASGEMLSFSFPEATQNVVVLTVMATDKHGYVGYADALVYDPYSSSGIYMDAVPTVASYIVEADGSGWFRAISKIGQQTASSTNDDDVMQYAINQTTGTGGMVFVRAAAYSATVTVKDNVCFVLDYGVSGVTYSIAASADCTVIDYAGKLRRDYSSGSLVYQFDYSTGNELISSANITTIYAGTIDQISSAGVKVLKLIVQNGTSFPSSPLNCMVFYRTDLGYLYLYNSTASSWVQIGTTAYGNLTGTPDLTVYLTKDGAAVLTGNWNVGGSYGIYGATWLNSTSINAQNWYLNGAQLGFITPATFIIDSSGSNIRMWFGANSTLAWQSTNASKVMQFASGNLTTGRTWIEKIVLKGNFAFDSALHVPNYYDLELIGKATFTAGTDMIINADPGPEWINIHGGVWNGTDTVTDGVHFTATENSGSWQIHDLMIFDTTEWGIKIDGAQEVYTGAFSIYNVQSLWSGAFYFHNCADFQVYDIPESGQIKMIGCAHVQLDNIYVYRTTFELSSNIQMANFHLDLSGTYDGLVLNATYNGLFTNGEICKIETATNNTGIGIYFIEGGWGSTYNQFTNVKIWSTSDEARWQYGVYEDTALSDNNTFVNVDTSLNCVTGIKLTGTNSHANLCWNSTTWLP